jgi:hypothetical protein
MEHGPEWYTREAWVMRRRFKAADTLVALANWIIRKWTDQTPAVWPRYRPVDTHIPGIGDHEFACAAYSYENLKSGVEQDGPDGYGATQTVKSLISAEGWESLEGMSMADLKATFAADGIGLSPPQKVPSAPWWRRALWAT